jgi:hypothetical protein
MPVMVLSLYGHRTGLNLISRILAEYLNRRFGICFLLILLVNDKSLMSNDKTMTVPMWPYSLSPFVQRIRRA